MILALPTISLAAARPMTPLQMAILKDKDIYSPTCDIRGKPIANIPNLLSKGADVNERDAEGNIALVQALRLNDVSQTLLLLERGADSKLLNNAGESPLLKGLSGDYQNGAYSTQDVLNIVLSAQGLPSDSNQFFKEAVQKNLTLLLSHDIKVPAGYSEENLWKDLNWVNPPSSTWRIIRQNFKAYQSGARFLTPKLRSPALVAPLEDSKLIKAIKAGDLKAVEELLKKGESPDQISAYFHDSGDVKLPPPEDTGLYANPALGVALHLKKFDIVHALLESGANPNIRGQFYLTSPDGKRSYPMYGVPLLYVAVGMGDENLVKDFASHHADLNQQSCGGWSNPLTAAKTLPMAELLVSLGADVNFKFGLGSGTSVLETFMREDSEAKKIFAYLLDQGADPNLRAGSTPILYRSLTPKGFVFTEILLKHGADPDLRDSRNINAAESFKFYNRKDVIDYMSSKQSARKTEPGEALLQGISWGDSPFVENLLDTQLDDVKGQLGAALWETTKKITEKNWDNVDSEQYAQLIRLLVDKGANPAQQDVNGNTLLHVTREPDLISFLVGNGANVNAVNSKGETPLEKAAQSGFVDMAATLILNKADPAPISAKYPDFYKSIQDRLNAGKILSSQISEAIKKSPSVSSKAYLNEPVYREYQTQLAAYNAAVELEKSEKEEKEKPFDETKWQELVAEHSGSPCLKDRTAKCLMRQVAKMKSAQGKMNLGDSAGYSESARADGNFVEAVINYGDQETARELLKLMPDSAKAQRMSLLFMAKEYELAMKILNELQETQKAGTDYGAIWALTQAGDLDKAFELAKTVITWQYTDLNPPPAGTTRISRSGFCVGNITSAYPRSIGVLASKLADLKQYEKAHEAAKMLRQYIANKLNGRGYFNCNWKSAKWAYEDAIFGLAEALSKNGERKRAKSIYDEIQSSAKEMDTNALLIAGEMKHNGFEKEVSSISSSIENTQLRDPNPDDMFFDQRVRQESDPGTIALGTGGEYEQAIKRLDGLSYPNIRVNTFIDLAQSASKDKKAAELKEILDHLSPYLGKRDRPIDNALDYLDYASLRFEADDKEASRASLNTALEIYETLKNRQMYERLELGGKVTLLFAKLGDYTSMADFMKNNAIDYNSGAGTTLTNILSYFASNDLWDEFDKFLSEQGELFKQKGGGEFKDKFSLRGSLGGILISKKQFERYLKVSDAMESPEQQYYKFKSLVIAGFKKDSGVPDDLFEDMWKRNLEGCKTRKEPTAEKKMVGCYMELLGAIQDSGMFSRTRGDVYMRSGY